MSSVLGTAFVGCSGSPDASATSAEDLSSEASSVCVHDVLCTGSALPPARGKSGCTTSSGANGYCVPEVCADLPSCCSTAWTDECVQDMENYTKAGGSKYNDCPSPGASPAPACSFAADAGSRDSGSSDSGSGQDAGTDAGGGSDAGGTLPVLPSPTLASLAMKNLTFGLFGDVRPANPNDTASYPDIILQSIFSGLEAQGLSLAIDVGDHCFQSSISSGSYCHDQFVNHFMADKVGRYSGTLIPTLGNHEACGKSAATKGNCTSFSSGLIRDFLDDIVLPTTGQATSPYYSFLAYGSWGTAKFVHIAANAWTSGQDTWLRNTLSVPTTYTFVVRHEPSSDTRAPGVTPSEALIKTQYANGTLTLSLTGHTHQVQLPGSTNPYGDSNGATQPYEVIVGNGGAPLDAGPYYGFAVLTRRASDGAIVTQSYETISSDGTTSLNDIPDPNFRFAVNADGSANSSTTLP